MKPLPPIPGLPSSVAQGSRLKPLLPNADLSVGGASAPNFRPSMAWWSRMKPPPTIPGLPSSVAQKVAAEAAPTKCRSFCRRGFSPELSALDGPVVTDEAASHNPRPSVFSGARVAAKAAPTKCRSFCRRGFSPELSALDGPVVADEAASPNPRPSVFGGAKGRG